VDDDNITNFINKRIIEKLDIAKEIGISTNGIEALEYIKEFCSSKNNCCPEIILLDINMPVMDGFEFLKRYSDMKFLNKESIKIYLLTTSTYSGDIDKAIAYKVAGVLNKPLTEDMMKKIVARRFIPNT
jgi:CheY-like chemotaxis protein